MTKAERPASRLRQVLFGVLAILLSYNLLNSAVFIISTVSEYLTWEMDSSEEFLKQLCHNVTDPLDIVTLTVNPLYDSNGCTEGESPRFHRFMSFNQYGRSGNNRIQLENMATAALRLQRGLVISSTGSGNEEFGNLYDLSHIETMLQPYGGLFVVPKSMIPAPNYNMDSLKKINWEDFCSHYTSQHFFNFGGHVSYLSDNFFSDIDASTGEKCWRSCIMNDFGILKYKCESKTSIVTQSLKFKKSILDNSDAMIKLFRGKSAGRRFCTAHIRRFDCEEDEKCNPKCEKLWRDAILERTRVSDCLFWVIFSSYDFSIDDARYLNEINGDFELTHEKKYFTPRSKATIFQPYIAAVEVVMTYSDVHLETAASSFLYVRKNILEFEYEQEMLQTPSELFIVQSEDKVCHRY